jgi:hypothetical protein
MNTFFRTTPDYSNIPSSGLVQGHAAYRIPETPGPDFPVPGGWEMSQQTQLTPVGEGVFRQLMGLGPMDTDPMELGWSGAS